MAILFRRLWRGANAEGPPRLTELFMESSHQVKSSSKYVEEHVARISTQQQAAASCLNTCYGSLKAAGCLLFSHLFPAHHSPKFTTYLSSGAETKTGKLSKAGQGREQRQRGSKRQVTVQGRATRNVQHLYRHG